MNNFKEHIFNASYLAIFLYGMRRIVRRIRPISFDDAYSLVAGLIKRQGDPIFLVHKDGTYYHVANAPTKYNRDVVGAIATAFATRRNNQWARVVAQPNEDTVNGRVVWNIPLTKFLPPEMQNRIPVLAQNLKKAYGENR